MDRGRYWKDGMEWCRYPFGMGWNLIKFDYDILILVHSVQQHASVYVMCPLAPQRSQMCKPNATNAEQTRQKTKNANIHPSIHPPINQ